MSSASNLRAGVCFQERVPRWQVSIDKSYILGADYTAQIIVFFWDQGGLLDLSQYCVPV